MSRNSPALEQIRRAAGRLMPPSDSVWRWLPVGIGLVFVVLIGLLLLFASGRGLERVTITTGTEGGSYFALAQVIADALAQADPPLRAGVMLSNGAAENAQRARATRRRTARSRSTKSESLNRL